jgi:hypothetical protein
MAQKIYRWAELLTLRRPMLSKLERLHVDDLFTRAASTSLLDVADQENVANSCVLVTRAVQCVQHRCLSCFDQCDLAETAILDSLEFDYDSVEVHA